MNQSRRHFFCIRNGHQLSTVTVGALFGVLSLFYISTPNISLAQETKTVDSSDKKPDVRKKIRKKIKKRKNAKKVRRYKMGSGGSSRKAKKRGKKHYSRSRMAKKKKSGAVIQSLRNKVTIQKAGSQKWERAKKKTAVSRSDQIKTGKRSMARIKLDDGSRILLLSNSQAEMDSLSSVKKTIKLLRGRVRAIVKKLKARSFKIQTPIGVASVRGTEFEVEYLEDSKEMEVDVIKGSVGVSKLGDLSDEVILQPGDKIRFGIEGEMGSPIRTGFIPINRQTIQQEVQISSVKNQVVAMAAEESRNADFQVGKSLIDVDGSRVRVEEYITRPSSREFKLVALNHRATRFDYFTYRGKFNTDLPADLSVALRDLNGNLGSEPTYYLEEYDMTMSNTVDTILDSGRDGNLVEIAFDGTNYTLTDPNNRSNTRTIAAAELQGDSSYKVYNPIKDKFSLVSAANLSDALKISISDGGTFRDFASGDTYYKARFNQNTFSINGTVKTAHTPTTSNNILALDLDATFTTSPAIHAASTFPSGTDKLHNKLTLTYQDGSQLIYDNYIIDDEGTIAGTSSFGGLSDSASYQNELENWNYQTKISASEMGGRTINLVIDPRIGTMSGLIE